MNEKVRSRLELGFALALSAVLGVFAYTCLSYPKKPRELPLLVCAIGLVLLAMQIAQSIVQVVKTSRSPGKVEGNPRKFALIGLCFLTTIVYVVLCSFLGFIVSSILYVFALGTLLGYKNKIKLAVVSVVTGLVLYIIFVRFLATPLPSGILVFLSVWRGV